MPFSMKVGLRPGDIVRGDIVLDGDQLPPRKAAQQPQLFGPRLLWPNYRPSQQQYELLFELESIDFSTPLWAGDLTP